MLSLYEILKASKTGIATDMWTALAGMNWGGAGSGAETKELTGIPPLSIRSNGTMLLDYLISGNMSQTGTPTPTTPIQPSETGDKTANLMPAGELKTVEVNGITFGSDGKGKYSIRGTATAYASARFNLLQAFTTPISVSNGGQGTLSFFNTSSDNNVTFVFYNGTTRVDDWKQTPIRRTTTTYNAIGNKYVDSVVITVNSGVTVDMTITPEFTNDGVLPSEYELYGYKIPISSAGQTTPVYLGEVETTRRVKKLVLTGQEETINFYGGSANRVGAYLNRPDMLSNSRLNGFSTHFLPQSTPSGSQIDGVTFGASNTYVFFTFSSDTATALNLTDLNSIKAWFQQQYATGSPVTIWYVLAEPTTGIVNEPLRKIGDYADTISYEQAGVQIPTVKGNTVIDVETVLKPSEMYIKYQE